MISEFAKEKVFWTRKMNLKLVKFIQSRPNIWNPKHPKYTSVEYRDRTYAEFAAKYGNEFTGQAVKDRWTNIRSTFANYLRKIKASQAKSDGEEYRVNWHLWEACQFLRKVNRAVKLRVEDMDIEEKKEVFFTSEEKDSQNELDYNSDQYSDNNSTHSNISCQGIAESLVSVFKAVQNDSFTLNNSKYEKVGKAVTKKLNEMNSFEAAKMTQQIIDILCLYDKNNVLNPNCLKTECI
ncbi:uncharacterized protein LOC125072472 [Vanessa atalanta]|uniref:uncharacterized protein LOC125072472 n=1 Tax=Vanessa atalanta TaxID=42275 RepID=UPI001FCDDC15|nr:uncharacterized protein LOC125072472 [Vanessa atalanta]